MTTRTFQGTIPLGTAGAMKTLSHMRGAVRQSLLQAPVVEQAARVTMLYPSRDQQGQAFAIRQWLVSVFRFVRDPVGIELLRTPLYQLREIQKFGIVGGDCDDAAILGAAMGMAAGIPAKFRILAFRERGEYAHVYTLLTPRVGGAIDLDVTKPLQGAAVPVRWKDFDV